MKFLCFILNIPYPKIKIGDIFVHEDSDGNPFDAMKYKVLEIKNKWALLQIGDDNAYYTRGEKLRDLRAFYIKL